MRRASYDDSMYIVVIILVLIAAIVGPGIWVKRVLERYSVPDDRYSGTGADLARHLLDLHGLEQVRVESTTDGDHYDPENKAVRLSEDKFNGRSLTAITVAAHEVGHAIQDQQGYAPLQWRSRLIRGSRIFERVGAGVLLVSPFIGALTRVPGLGILMFAAGFITLATSTLVHFVTLPTEFDASFGRALPILDKHSILIRSDRPHARRLLTAAALTYVSASLMSLVNIARWIALLRR
jgi:Zn-dependent membrane protease YugP